MNRKIRFVFDANVLVSAVLFKSSIPPQAFNKALDNGEILLSIPILTELSNVLNREKFDKYLRRVEKQDFLGTLLSEAALNDPIEQIKVCRDPTDDKYIELAVSGDAEYIVSGDSDLLILDTFRDIKILTPKQLLRVNLR